jgi:hypothetical protein
MSFRSNTCRSVSKQTALTALDAMFTENTGGGHSALAPFRHAQEPRLPGRRRRSATPRPTHERRQPLSIHGFTSQLSVCRG